MIQQFWTLIDEGSIERFQVSPKPIESQLNFDTSFYLLQEQEDVTTLKTINRGYR